MVLRLRVGGKFFLTVGVLVPAVLAVAGVGALGLERLAGQNRALYDHGVGASQRSADVVAATYRVQETALYQVAIRDEHLDAQLTAELDTILVPRLQQAITVLRADHADEPAHVLAVDGIQAGLEQYLQLRATGIYSAGSSQPVTDAARSALAARTDQLLEPMAQAGESLRTQEAVDAAGVKQGSDATYLSTRVLLAVSVVVVLLLGLAVVTALIRNMLPRIRTYSGFAADVAAGRTTTALEPHGHDELTELGTALNDMVLQRAVTDLAAREQRALVTRAEQAQAEFVDVLQVTLSEDEAQELLQSHLQRSLPDSAVAVLRRNNSANRLQAATPLPAGSPLTAKLVGAEPRSCVAVRLGRTHREGTGQEPLLSCVLCGDRDHPSTCEPLLVGGEVIGAVLVSRPDPLTDADAAKIRTTVGQAAPVLANLRTLALAEFRANNDSLTGLPNKRATEDSLKRMVAQAARSVTPLSAIMLDLDHFKEINDRFGHASGDEVLAAVGAAIASGVRASDFAGRFGGEEFLLLLPDTPVGAAWHVAEKIRASIALITVPGVEREITASLGIAGLLEHAGNATGLLREADRAQYAAKAAGRNRSVMASAEPVGAEAVPQAVALAT